MSTARKGVDPRVRVTRMDDHLFVLFEPRIHRLPVEAHEIADRLERRLGVAPRAVDRFRRPALDGEVVRVATARRVGHRVGGDEACRDVPDGDVVGGVVGDLPHERRVDRVEDDLAAEVTRARACGPVRLGLGHDARGVRLLRHQASFRQRRCGHRARTHRTDGGHRGGRSASNNTASASLSSPSSKWPKRSRHSAKVGAHHLPGSHRQRCAGDRAGTTCW